MGILQSAAFYLMNIACMPTRFSFRLQRAESCQVLWKSESALYQYVKLIIGEGNFLVPEMGIPN
jgi:hypothetical protein